MGRLISRRAVLQALAAQALSPVRAFGQARVLRKPKPLPRGAVTSDWASFLGPSHNAVSAETRLTRVLPPPLVWEFPKGTGYASPAVAGQRLVFIHRLDDEEIVECLHPETGSSLLAVPISDRLRGSLWLQQRTAGESGHRRQTRLHGRGRREAALPRAATGKVVWKRDLRAEYKVPQDFFGTASTPLVEGRLLIVNVGAPGGPCVVGLDKATGREVWRAGDEWGPSYASPVPAVIHGQRRVFVFAGGESDPPTGGLMSIDPATGHVDFVFPWRSRTHESVNASCPVVFDNKVFISASYRTGSALVDVQPDFTHKVRVDDAGIRPALQYGDPPRWLPLRVRRPERAGRVAGLRRCRDRERSSGGRRRNGPRRSARAGAGGSNWSAPIEDRCWPRTASSCASAKWDTCCG